MRRGKNMEVIREMDPTKKQRDLGRGDLKDYSLQHKVSVAWDLNPEAMNDRMFKLTIDDYEVILDSEEMMRYCRWV